jgi:hypothetical protein
VQPGLGTRITAFFSRTNPLRGRRGF